MSTYNMYVDESCHLENDGFPVMCIGYMKTDSNNYEDYRKEIKSIKLKHKNPVEVKWANVSASRLPLYKELIDYFFSKEIYFRCILVRSKSYLEYRDKKEVVDDSFYYNLIYHLLNTAINPIDNEYRVFLDIKDTRGRDKLEKIYQKLSDEYQNASPFIHFQHIHSIENVFLQLTDLFIGAVAYKARNEDKKINASKSKIELVNYLEEKSGHFLNEGTEPWENKFNIFDHQPKKK